MQFFFSYSLPLVSLPWYCFPNPNQESYLIPNQTPKPKPNLLIPKLNQPNKQGQCVLAYQSKRNTVGQDRADILGMHFVYDPQLEYLKAVSNS